ncbi:MAG: hypothetical protein A3J70_05990 [Elusimicrobia bacterium RIFCSPHIGHO2_02_FULL_61_10]|nr:MAG: hypothetical protein A3J70_05990 [Elusimicrobia bacterium RIFCSPHIGHO2_02_FULL_61_10]
MLAQETAQQVADGAADRDGQRVEGHDPAALRLGEPFGQVGRRHRAVAGLADADGGAGEDKLAVIPYNAAEKGGHAPENRADAYDKGPAHPVAEIADEGRDAHVNDHERGGQEAELSVTETQVGLQKREDGV